MTERINYMGEQIALSKLVAHYRLMMRACPQRRDTYRWLLRQLIINARSQRAERQAHREAA
jgi:hypothetical protein